MSFDRTMTTAQFAAGGTRLIASLKLEVRREGVLDNGNLIGLGSTYTTDDGDSHAAADVWFAQGLTGQVSAMAQALSGFDAGAAGTLTQPPVGAALANQVARMADALQHYGLDSPGLSAHLSDHETLRLKALQPSTSPGLLAAP